MRFKGGEIDRDFLVVLASIVWFQEIVGFTTIGNTFEGVNN